MSAAPQNLTKCARDGCDRMTARTFCSRACNHLAHCGPGTRALPRRSNALIEQAAPMSEGADATGTLGRVGWFTLRAYCRNPESSQNSSGARRIANIRKRRQEREELARKRRAAAKKRRGR